MNVSLFDFALETTDEISERDCLHPTTMKLRKQFIKKVLLYEVLGLIIFNNIIEIKVVSIKVKWVYNHDLHLIS